MNDRKKLSSCKPTYDTYSIGVTLLHMCVGYQDSIKV